MGGCGCRFQALAPTLANGLWSAVCHVRQLCLSLWVLGIVATGSSPTDPPDLDFCLAKAKGSQAACHCRMQGGLTRGGILCISVFSTTSRNHSCYWEEKPNRCYFKSYVKKIREKETERQHSLCPQDNHLARVDQATGTVMKAPLQAGTPPNRPSTPSQSPGAWTLQITVT
uniref:Uncharacterized protein n=1 Tax=Myotis myotis TaxID=51298 RepID=A0A7J7U5M3_MYOMY|nr:hypothetical protein mMyoMyo1_008864 [Myotis myotis]